MPASLARHVVHLSARVGAMGYMLNETLGDISCSAEQEDEKRSKSREADVMNTRIRCCSLPHRMLLGGAVLLHHIHRRSLALECHC